MDNCYFSPSTGSVYDLNNWFTNYLIALVIALRSSLDLPLIVALLIAFCLAKTQELNCKLWPGTQTESRFWPSAGTVLGIWNSAHFPSVVGALHFKFTVLQVRWSDKALFLNFGLCVHSFQLYSGVLLPVVSTPLFETPFLAVIPPPLCKEL